MNLIHTEKPLQAFLCTATKQGAQTPVYFLGEGNKGGKAGLVGRVRVPKDRQWCYSQGSVVSSFLLFSGAEKERFTEGKT